MTCGIRAWRGCATDGVESVAAALSVDDLATDLSETKDVAADHPDVVRRLTMLMDREHTPSDRWKLPGER